MEPERGWCTGAISEAAAAAAAAAVAAVVVSKGGKRRTRPLVPLLPSLLFKLSPVSFWAKSVAGGRNLNGDLPRIKAFLARITALKTKILPLNVHSSIQVLVTNCQEPSSHCSNNH